MDTNTFGTHRLLIFLCALVFVFVLTFTFAACGTNTSTGNSISTLSTPGQTTASGTHTSGNGSAPTATSGQANINGCPSNAIGTTQPATSTHILKSSNSNVVIRVHKGDTIEVELLFGRNWRGPANANRDLLSMQTPAGYASPTAGACIWHFVAIHQGTANLIFTGLPLCQKSQACPMNAVDIEFTVEIK